MNVYNIRVDSTGKAASFSTIHLEDAQRLDKSFGGDPYGSAWSPMPIERSRYRGNKRRPLADIARLNSQPILVFSARARKILEPYLQGLGEWFELKCAEAPYFIFNLTRVIDALDTERCEFKYYSDGGIMHIASFAFHRERVAEELLFKVPQRPGAFNLATDRFKDLVERHGLTGFRFDRVWSDEPQAAQAANTAPPPEAPAQPQPAPTVRPLEPGVAASIGSWCTEARQVLGLRDDAPYDEVLQAIDGYVDRWQDEDPEESVAAGIVDALAALWGEQLVREFGWRWCRLDFGGEPFRAVCAADGSLSILPWAYLRACFEQVELDCAIALAGNMLAAGRVPAQPAGGYVDVMHRVAYVVPKR